MTKKQILGCIENLLRWNDLEVCVVKFEELHEVGTKMHAYAIGYEPEDKCVVVRPWSGADYHWKFDITRISKARMTELHKKVSEDVAKVVFPYL